MERTIRNKNQKGSALISVLCVLLVIMALLLSMVLASYQVLSQARESAAKEQARIAASSFDQAFQAQIESTTQDDKSSVGAYLYNKIQGGQWIEGTEIALSLDLLDDKTVSTGNIAVTLQWDAKEALILTTKTTCTFRKQVYTVISTYALDGSSSQLPEGTWKWSKR